MLRGIFIYVASTLPSRRRGFRHASSQSIKKRSRRSSTRPECPAGVGFGATRLCILDRIAYPEEIYSHAKIFLTNVQTPGAPPGQFVHSFPVTPASKEGCSLITRWFRVPRIR